MRPSTNDKRMNRLVIAAIVVACLVVMPWALTSVSAQGGTSAKKSSDGEVRTATKLVVNKVMRGRMLLGGEVYHYATFTKYLDGNGYRIRRKSIVPGTVVNITYITGRNKSEMYPFSSQWKVLSKVQIVGSQSK